MTSSNGTGDVDTISTDTRARPGEYVHNGTTTDAVNTINSSGRRDPATPPSIRDMSGVSTSGPHPTFQQQVPELAGVVQAFPGGH